MPSVCRLSDVCTGHGCFPPRPNVSASGDVFVNSRGAHRVADAWAVHCCKSCHPGNTVTGSSSVFVNGRALARVGDAVNCGSRIASGSPTVYAGG